MNQPRSFSSFASSVYFSLAEERPPLSGSRPFGFFAMAFVAGLLVAGCGHGSLSVRDSSAFQNAPPEIKSQWENAVAAAKSNGYLAAYTTLQNLRAQTNLDDGQGKAVEELIGVVGTRMFKAANDGDPEAVKAMKEIQSAGNRSKRIQP